MPTPNIRLIREERTPLRGHPILSGTVGAMLAKEEYRRAVEAVRSSSLALGRPIPDARDFSPLLREASGLYREILLQERDIRPNLRELAVEVAVEAHALERSMVDAVLNADFAEPGALGIVGADADPEPPAVANDRVRSAVAKRRTHNALIHGIALDHMCRALALAKTALDHLRPDLYPRYHLFSNLAELLHFTAPIGLSGCARNGVSRIDWDEKGEAEVTVRADCFPVLLQEISKGLAELTMAHGLPQQGELEPQEAGQFLMHADNELHESLYFMMGPALARRVNKALAANGGIMRHGERPDPGLELVYARSILSLLAEEYLHAMLAGLLSEDEATRIAATEKLAACLRDAESFVRDDRGSPRRSP